MWCSIIIRALIINSIQYYYSRNRLFLNVCGPYFMFNLYIWGSSVMHWSCQYVMLEFFFILLIIIICIVLFLSRCFLVEIFYKFLLVLWWLPFVNLRSVFTKKLRFTVRFRFLRFPILIMCRANTNDTGKNTCIAVVQNSDLRHSRRSRCNAELIIISMLQVATWNNICCWFHLYMW